MIQWHIKVQTYSLESQGKNFIDVICVNEQNEQNEQFSHWTERTIQK